MLTLLIKTAIMEGGASTSTGSFSFPPFHSYPPSFTLQPVRETRDKQSAMWGDLILAYCRQHKVGGCTMRHAILPCHVLDGCRRTFLPATATLALARLFWRYFGHLRCNTNPPCRRETTARHTPEITRGTWPIAPMLHCHPCPPLCRSTSSALMKRASPRFPMPA